MKTRKQFLKNDCYSIIVSNQIVRKLYIYKTLFYIMLLFSLLTLQRAQAQSVAINNSGSRADSSAILDISSSTKGLLIPRMDSSSRVSIHNPAKGLIVYQLDKDSGLYYNAGSSAIPDWIAIQSNISGWSTKGNYGTNSTTSYIGTNDAQDLVIKTNSRDRFRFLNASRSVQGGDSTIATGDASFAYGLQDSVTGDFSGAFGWANTISGMASFATGGFNVVKPLGSSAFGATNIIDADGQTSFAAGDGNYINAESSIALGRHQTILGTYSTAAGADNIIDTFSYSSIALGNVNTIGTSDTASVVLGEYNTIQSQRSLTMGSHNTNMADYSIVNGYKNLINASAPYSYTSGSFNDIHGDAANSVVLGLGLIANQNKQTIIGYYNDTTYNGGLDAGTNQLFAIGNGVKSGNTINRSNALTVLKNGNVGIGTVNPVNTLQIEGNVSLGHQSTTLGKYSIAAGADNIINASAYGSVALGSLNTISSNDTATIIAGDDNSASSSHSITLGSSNINSGNYSIALGYSNNISNSTPFSFAIGLENEIHGDAKYAHAIGQGLILNQNNQIVLGRYNDTTYNGGLDGNTNQLFAIGNGFRDGANNVNINRSNALTVLKNGNVGIGVVNPTNLLEVNGKTKTNKLEVNTTTKLNGSINMPIRTLDIANSGTTVSLDSTADYTVIFSPTATSCTVLLPQASNNKGVIFVIVNQTINFLPINRDPISNKAFIKFDGNEGTDVAAQSSITLQSNGADWIQIH